MIRAMVRLALIAVGAALTLSGCVSTAYGPTGDGRPYGYSERKREDGSYILRVSHPDEGLALTYWDQRAVELCGSTAYVKNIYQSIRPTMAYSNYGGMPGLVQLEGLLTCTSPAPATAPVPAAAPVPAKSVATTAPAG